MFLFLLTKYINTNIPVQMYCIFCCCCCLGSSADSVENRPLWPLRAPTCYRPSSMCSIPASLFHFHCFCRSFFCCFVFCREACFYMYTHAFVEHLPQAQHSTAQPSAINRAQSSNARKCRPENDNASKQTELARASVPPRYYTARCVLKTHEYSKSARPTR